ncbi:MAG: hypothetical protein L7F78_20340 [Syntrophales bacterium LBB04]|nr:hypothetical protein [Syntrophales bacterium LBB04]
MMRMNREKFFSRAGIIALLVLVFACAAPQQQTLRTEKDYQIAFNEAFFRGEAKMEVPVKYGRIDLLTDDYVIEVDRLEKFHEAIGQVLHYARETGKKTCHCHIYRGPATGRQRKTKVCDVSLRLL